MPRTVKRVAVLMNLSRVYDRQVVRGITRFVRSHSSWELYVRENPADRLPALDEWAGDGMIVDVDDRLNAKKIPRLAGPIVGMGVLSEEERRQFGISTVNTDDGMIADWAADHLLDKGLTSFGYCGSRSEGLDRWVAIRRDRFRERIANEGYVCGIFQHEKYSSKRWDRLLTGLKAWLEGLPKPVGIMACNDSRGRLVLDACRQLGLRVPDEAAVIGVDNDDLICELAQPPLSSILQGTEQIGFEAASLLDQLMRGQRRKPTHVTVSPSCLVPRQSSDMVAIDDPIVSRALRFIREHGTRPINVSDIVRHVEVSRSTLETRFKHHTGHTVHEEVQRVRLDAAKRLLTSTALPLHVIAERVGYSSVQYMSAVFRRELGHPPGRLRRPSDDA